MKNLVLKNQIAILDNITEGSPVKAVSNLGITYTFSMERVKGEETYRCQIGKGIRINSDDFDGIIKPVSSVKFVSIEF